MKDKQISPDLGFEMDCPDCKVKMNYEKEMSREIDCRGNPIYYEPIYKCPKCRTEFDPEELGEG